MSCSSATTAASTTKTSGGFRPTGRPPPFSSPITSTIPPPPRLLVRFTERVAASLRPSDFVLTDRATGQAVAAPPLSFECDSATDTASLPAGGLPDGNYRLTLAPGGVTNPASNAVAPGFSFDFFVLATDANRDRTVGFADLVILAQNYGTTGMTFS